MEPFPYPKLPDGVDAVRVLTVEPNTFYNPIRCKLDCVPFSSKPQYLALSYTWREAYAGDATLAHFHGTEVSARSSRQPTDEKPEASSPQLTVNGYCFPIQANLYLALLHLRSKTHPLVLWIDAVCIDQTNTDERNAQVSMMSFIFERAQKVVAWLGPKEHLNAFSMSINYDTGWTARLAAAVAGEVKMTYSPEPTMETFVRISQSAYWTRLWIVQEICIPRHLIIAHGSELWKYEMLWEWEALREVTPEQARSGEECEAMMRVLKTKKDKHKNKMKLKSLIEWFRTAGCSELRDRAYGLLGLAHDVHPVPLSVTGNAVGQSQGPPRGASKGPMGLQVDYARSFYDIWEDVVQLAYVQAVASDGPGWRNPATRITEKLNEQFDAESNEGLLDTETIDFRTEPIATVVRTAGVIQEAFGQKVEEELAALPPTKGVQPPDKLRLFGYIYGEIQHLGPEYWSLVSSYGTQQEWHNLLETSYGPSSCILKMRQLNECFLAKVIEYGNKDLGRIRNICGPEAIAYPIEEYVGSSLDGPFREELQAKKHDRDTKGGALRLCLGSNCLIGLVPEGVRAGDIVVRFLGCDAAIAMRRLDTNFKSFGLLGRVKVADLRDDPLMPPSSSRGANAAERNTALWESEDVEGRGVFLELDLRTLQLITASMTLY